MVVSSLSLLFHPTFPLIFSLCPSLLSIPFPHPHSTLHFSLSRLLSPHRHFSSLILSSIPHPISHCCLCSYLFAYVNLYQLPFTNTQPYHSLFRLLYIVNSSRITLSLIHLFISFITHPFITITHASIQSTTYPPFRNKQLITHTNCQLNYSYRHSCYITTRSPTITHL